MVRQTIGEFLQTLRKANGYTQQEVAERLGISNKTLSAWETDRAYPDLLSIPALADLYGVTADEILRGERCSANARGDNGGESERAALAVVEKYAEKKPPKQYTEKQRGITAKNRKLFVRCVIGAVIPCILILIAATVLLENTFSKTEELYSGTAEQVKHHLQDIVIETDSSPHEDYGVDAAAYYIDLPERDSAERYTTYYFDNGFEGVYSYYEDFWVIYYSPEGQDSAAIAVSYAYPIEIDDITVYNVRYGALAVTDNSLSDKERTASGEVFII